MKKLVLVFIVVIVFLSLSSYAQRAKSRARLGVKTERQVRRSVRTLNRQIANYRRQIMTIQQKDRGLIKRLKYQPQLAGTLKQDSTLLANLRSKVNVLEDQVFSLLSSSVALGDQEYIDLRGDATNIADAYLTISYAKREGERHYSSMMDTAVIINRWHRAVTVKVTGPNGFQYNTVLETDQKVRFEAPYIGFYNVTFCDGHSTVSVSKKKDPRAKSVYEGKEVAFFAITFK